MEMNKIIRKIAHDEWAFHHRNTFNWMALYILPIVLSLLICFIYQSHVLLKMPTVIVDQDKTISSLRMIRMLNQHRFISISNNSDDFTVGMRELRSRKAYALVMIPKGFEKEWKSGEQPTIKAYSYGTNLLVGKSLQKAITETVGQLNAETEVGKLFISRHESISSKNNFPPLMLQMKNLYNPSFNYQWFLPPGAIISIFQMLICLLGAIAFYGNKRNPFIKQSVTASYFQLFIGKSIPILCNYTLQGLFLWLVLFPLLGIPVRGNLLIGLGLWELLILTSFAIGFSISAIIKDSMISTVTSIFIMAPAFAFSGYTYPYWEMPLLHRIFAMIMPTTHFLPAFLQFYLQGSSFHIMIPRLVEVMIFSLSIYGLLLIARFIHKSSLLVDK